LFYQFVSRDLLANTLQEYARLNRAMRVGRDTGEVDWDAIEDRTRERVTWTYYEDPGQAIRCAAIQYAEDPWITQNYRVETWIEKDALTGVIEGICGEYDVPYLAHRGSNSQSNMYEAAKRFAHIIDHGQIPLVLHLTDHDPTGIDMGRDVTERLERYARQPIEVRRLGLTIAQVTQYRPPPNPTKETDSRYAQYKQQYGTDCWELDALSPTVIVGLIRDAFDELIDRKAWDKVRAKQTRNRKLMRAVADDWAKVEKLVRKRKIEDPDMED
jgi:hypothetical protein